MKISKLRMNKKLIKVKKIKKYKVNYMKLKKLLNTNKLEVRFHFLLNGKTTLTLKIPGNQKKV